MKTLSCSVIREGLIKRIHIDQHKLKAFKKGGDDPHFLTVQTSNGPLKGSLIEIHGPSKLVYRSKPLSCGANLWIETHAKVTLLQEK